MRDHPVHRQGRGRQDHRRRRYGGPRRARRACARWCCPPTPRTRSADAFGVPIGAEPDAGGRPACSCSRSTPSGGSSGRGARSRATCSRCSTRPGVDPITAEELTVIPGAEEVLALLELRTQVLSGRVGRGRRRLRADRRDAAAARAARGARAGTWTGCSRRERRIVKALRPVLAKAAGVPMPQDAVFDAVERLHRDLEEVQALLTGDGRERAAGAHPRDGRGGRGPALADHAVPVRLPGRRRDRQPGVPRRRGRRRVAAPAGSRRRPAVLAEVEQSFTGLPIWRSAYQPGEPVGRGRAGRRSPRRRTTATTRSRRRRASGR